MNRLLVGSLLVMPCVASAQQLASSGTPPLFTPTSSATAAVAVRALAPPSIDGKDNDPIWNQAQLITGFRMFEPVEDGPERFHTEAKVAYDEKYLYVLVRALDPHPDSIIALLSRRDVRTTSDQLKVMVDSYHDRRSGYEFAVNPIGVKRDYYMFNDSNEDVSWDGVWDVGTAIDDKGWVAEFRIPFSQLRFPKRASHVFGLMIWRDIARTNERVSWPVMRYSKAGIVSQFGELSGITGIGSPRRLEVAPYAVTKNVTQEHASGFGRQQQLTGGADVKYGVTSNLTLDATINPDFGQVEADPSVVNLTAFETFFEEKRPFFIEGTGIFRFDVTCNDDKCNGLFYSRRIGRAPQLSDLDGYSDASTPTGTTILGAAKLTGRLGGGLSLGVLSTLTQRERGVEGRTVEPQSNYFVGRLQQDFHNGESGVGAMLTAVDRSLDQWSDPYLRRRAFTGGVDFRHRFGGGRYEVRGFVAGSRVSGSAAAIDTTQRSSVHLFQRPDDGNRYDPTRTTLTGDAEQISLGKVAGGILRSSTVLSRFSPGFEINDLGFLPRADQLSLSNWVGLQYNTPGRFYRRAFLNFNEWQSYTTQGVRTKYRTEFGGNVNAHAQFKNSWWGHLGLGINNAAATFCDRCARGGPAVRLSPNPIFWAGIEGDTRRSLAPQLWVDGGRADEGRSYALHVNPVLVYRASSRFDVSVGPDYRRNVDDAQYVDQFGEPGSDTTHYSFAHLDQTTLGVTTRLNFTFTPNLSLQLYAQPFVSSGRYSNWRELDRPRSSRYAERYKPFTSVDQSAQLSDYDFNDKEFHSTTVLRWEYRSGSTLFLVWTQGRSQEDVHLGSFRFGRDYGDLFAAHPDNTFLVKVSYWFSP